MSAADNTTPAWEFTGLGGRQRFITQQQYAAQPLNVQKWYRPICPTCGPTHPDGSYANVIYGETTAYGSEAEMIADIQGAASPVFPLPADDAHMLAALDAPGCERLRDFFAVGPVQRAAVESFADALSTGVAIPQTTKPEGGV